MAKVGDRVRVTVQGPVELSSTAKIDVGQIILGGTVIDEEVGEWIIRLDAKFDGRNLLRVPKSSISKSLSESKT